jgi:hypothetical protein
MTFPSFNPPVQKVSFTLLHVSDQALQNIIEFVTAYAKFVEGEVIVTLEEVRDEPIPEVHIS